MNYSSHSNQLEASSSFLYTPTVILIQLLAPLDTPLDRNVFICVRGGDREEDGDFSPRSPCLFDSFYFPSLKKKKRKIVLLLQLKVIIYLPYTCSTVENDFHPPSEGVVRHKMFYTRLLNDWKIKIIKTKKRNFRGRKKKWPFFFKGSLKNIWSTISDF